MNTLTILDGSGDTTITWDHDDDAAREEARRTVADLKEKGYAFFLVDGSPADEVSAAAGKLIVRRLTAEEVTAPLPEPEPEATEPGAVDETSALIRPRGRPRKQVVATRPIQGG